MARYYVEIADAELGLEVTHTEHGTTVRPVDGQEGEHQVDFAPVHASPVTGEGLYSVILDGKSYQLYVAAQDAGYRMLIWRHRFDTRVLTEREWRLQKVAPKQSAQSGTMVVPAPMPGLVKAVLVTAGDEVKTGQRLVVLEAMKMEN